jgi:hypothetical protein
VPVPATSQFTLQHTRSKDAARAQARAGLALGTARRVNVRRTTAGLPRGIRCTRARAIRGWAAKPPGRLQLLGRSISRRTLYTLHAALSWRAPRAPRVTAACRHRRARRRAHVVAERLQVLCDLLRLQPCRAKPRRAPSKTSGPLCRGWPTSSEAQAHVRERFTEQRRIESCLVHHNTRHVVACRIPRVAP